MKLPQLPQDKANHFIYGFVIYVLANLFLNPYYSLAVVITFGVGREVVQKIIKKGKAEIMDAVWTIIPALILMLVMLFSQQSKAQNSIVSGGNSIETFGENITRIQTFDTVVQVNLNNPKWEYPTETPKPIKKKSLFEKILDFIKQLINKQK